MYKSVSCICSLYKKNSNAKMSKSSLYNFIPLNSKSGLHVESSHSPDEEMQLSLEFDSFFCTFFDGIQLKGALLIEPGGYLKREKGE